MDVRELRKLQQAYSEVYQEIDENLIQSLDTLARDTAGRVGGKIGERIGRAETGNLPVLGDIGATIGRGQGTESGKQIYDKAKKTVGGLLKQSYDPDLFDVILEYLLDEGYADTEQAAEAIMVNMSEEWRESIVVEGYKEIDREKHGRMYDRYKKLGAAALKDARETGEASGDNRFKMSKMMGVIDKSAENLRNKR